MSDCIDLVDEDDRGRPFARVREQVPHPGGSDTHEHFDKARPGESEERHFGFPGDGAGHERLAAAGWSHHQHSPRTYGARFGVAVGILQEVDDFAHLALGTLVAGDVGKARGGTLDVVHLGLRAPDTHDPARQLAAGTS